MQLPPELKCWKGAGVDGVLTHRRREDEPAQVFQRRGHDGHRLDAGGAQKTGLKLSRTTGV